MIFSTQRVRCHFAPIFATLLIVASPVFAVELISTSVEVQDGRYHVFGESRLAANSDFIYDVLMDFDNFYKLADGIAETRFLPADDSGILHAYTRFETCILVFCRKVEKVEQVTFIEKQRIDARVIPDQSDFVLNESSWIIEAEAETNSTKLTFEAVFEADFWIPPFIGLWAVKRKLVNSAELMGTRIEYMSENNLTLKDL